ncbi:cytochrome oxidase putative small subunit CydP [Legionella israelensis]|uniref:cytochrome oxidase putative small subunit CydP n=1 Tax=Legionella israelensis TaxID=454 RepID=UPI003158BAE0
MRPLTRDILVTLIIKLSLLIALWFVCFKNVEKPSKDVRQWLLGTDLSTHISSNDHKP